MPEKLRNGHGGLNRIGKECDTRLEFLTAVKRSIVVFCVVALVPYGLPGKKHLGDVGDTFSRTTGNRLQDHRVTQKTSTDRDSVVQ
jgi:hypothetical protein